MTALILILHSNPLLLSLSLSHHLLLFILSVPLVYLCLTSAHHSHIKTFFIHSRGHPIVHCKGDIKTYSASSLVTTYSEKSNINVAKQPNCHALLYTLQVSPLFHI